MDDKVHKFNFYDAEFFDHDDRLGHTDDVIKRQSEFINMNTIRAGKGDKCLMSDWASVKYKGYKPGGQEVYDSSNSVNGGKKYFRVGYYEVSKCFDIAVQQMKPGQISAVFCPGTLDKGGNINQYPDVGSSWIPTYTDMKYEIEVLGCDPKIEVPKPSRPPYELINGKCFYLLSE